MRRLPLALAAAAGSIAIASIVVAGGLLDAAPAASPGAAARASVPAATDGTAAQSVSPTPTPASTPARPASTPYIARGADRPGVAEALQAALEAGRVALAAPGIQASVIFPDGHQWTGVAGVADLATGRPLTPDTPFAIASASKTFLATEILLLVDEGRLALDDSAAGDLPTTLVGGKAIDPRITIRMLLDHTSGLGDYLVSPALDKAVQADPRAVWTPDQALAYARPPVAPPGRGYHYANTNYVLLGLIAERLTGRTLAEEYRARFFDRLGLASASYQGAEPPKAELPTAYRYSSTRLSAKPTDVTDGTSIRPFTAITTAAGAAGSIAISARDLAHWARALYDGYVLPPDMLALMLADAAATETLDPPYPYGLGVQVYTIDDRVSFGHSGRLVGARSVVRWFPEDGIGIAVVTNESRYDVTTVVRHLLAIAAPHGTGRPDRPI